MVVLCLIFAGWYFLLGRPLDMKVVSVSAQLTAERKKLAAHEKALASIPELLKSYDSLKTTVGHSYSDFSGEEEVTRLYQTLDSICRRPDYKLDEITPSLQEVIRFLREWEVSDSAIYLPIRIKIYGRYQPLARLIETVEASSYFDSLTHVSLNGSDELYPNCRLDFSFVVGLNNRLGMFELE
jgi:Tfp pilus assembly protein PilO